MKKIGFIVIVPMMLTLIACGGAEERKAAYLEKAENSLDAGDIEKARIELKNVLQIDPKDARAHFKLGNIQEKRKEYQKAFVKYRKAVELSPDNSEFQAKLGEFYLLIGDYDKVREIMAQIDVLTPNNMANSLLNIGLLAREKDVEGAILVATKLVTDNPAELRPVMMLAQLYKKQEDYNAVLATLDKASELDAKDADIKRMTVEAHVLLKNYDKAETVLKEIVALEPQNYKNHTQLAVFYKTAMDDAAAGEKVLRNALKINEDDIQRKLNIITYLRETKGNAAAETELKAMIKHAGNDELNQLRMMLAQFYNVSDRLDEEIAVYKSIIDSGDVSSTGMNARVNLAKLYVKAKKMDEAAKTIDEALEAAPNDPDALLLRSRIALLNNDNERAIIDLRLVIKDKPENIEAYKLLLGAYVRDKNTNQARELLDKAYENNLGNVSSLLELADIYLQLNNIKGAEKAVDSAIHVEEGNIKALTLKTRILNTKKDYQQSAEYASRIIELYPDNVIGYQLISPAMVDAGQVDELYSLIKDGYEKTKYDNRLLKIMVTINSGQKKFDLAIKTLKSEIEKQGEVAELYRMLAKIYDSSGNRDQSIANFKKAIKIKYDLGDLYGELANVYVRSNNTPAAIDILKQGKSALPADDGISIALAALYERTGKAEDAMSEYEGVLSRDDSNIIATNNLASLISDYRTDKASIDYALVLVEKLKSNKQVVLHDTIGWVYYKAGRYMDAVKTLETVVQQLPDNAIFNYHMGMAYYKYNNRASAKEYLEKSLSSGDDFLGKNEAEALLKQL